MLCYSSGFTGLVIMAEKLLQAPESGGVLVMGVLRLQHLLARGLWRVIYLCQGGEGDEAAAS